MDTEAKACVRLHVDDDDDDDTNSQDVFYDWEADFKTGTGLII